MSTSSDPRLTCPRREEHAPSPRGYLAWHTWAEEKAKTHRPIRCEGCGRYSIWVKSAEGPGGDDDD